MYKRKIYLPFLSGLLLLILFTMVSVRKENVLAQPGLTAPAKEFKVKEITVKEFTAPDDSTSFKAAAQQNAQLKNNLKWVFGSKSQTGWYLYVPLIQHLLGTEAEPETAQFALALSAWQQKSRLEPNGVLGTETLQKMVQYWQSRRLNRSIYPAENELLTAPITDFYDPTRGAELLKVQRHTYTAYKRMVAAALADKSLKLNDKQNFLKIVSSFRSREYQEKLRQQSPNSGRAGLAVNSPHFTGQALDLYVGGEPVATRDDNRALQVKTPVYRWLVKNAEKFGFYPYYYEPWHWEYAPKN